jgi:hypothetical protein
VETSYSYRYGWSSSLVSSWGFYKSPSIPNPTSWKHGSQVIRCRGNVDGLVLSDEAIDSLAAKIGYSHSFKTDYTGHATYPVVGDERLTYSAVLAPDEASVLGMVKNGKIGSLKASNGREVMFASKGIVSAQGLATDATNLRNAQAAESRGAWLSAIGLFGGLLLCFGCLAAIGGK